tara:strand:+ start:122 stop:226 length:105 start_codon:yes stop_codon:yes gene_type:complete
LLEVEVVEEMLVAELELEDLEKINHQLLHILLVH